MKLLFYILLSVNILCLVFLLMFIRSRGGVDYLKAKYNQVVNKESINDSLIEFRENRIESFRKLPVSDSAIFMVGDSITENGPWQELLACNVKNRGIGGETTDGLQEWFSELIKQQPLAIVLLIGINNLKSGKADVEDYLSDMRDFCRDSAEIPLYLVGVLPVNEQMAQGFIHCKNADLIRVNRELEKIADEFGHVQFVNAWPALTEGTIDSLKEQYTIDGVHLSYDGYVRYCAKVLKPLLGI